MKKLFYLIVIATLITAGFLLADKVKALWNGAEGFEDYTDGDDLSGSNGGDGWSGAWSEAGSGTWAIDDGDEGATPPEGTKMAFSDNVGTVGSAASSTRSLTTPDSDGTILFQVAGERPDRDELWVEIYDNNAQRAGRVRLEAADDSGDVHFQIWNQSTTAWEDVATGLSGGGTFYEAKIKYDCSTDTYQAAINNSGLSASKGMESNCDTIDDINLYHYHAFSVTQDHVYFDDIESQASTSSPAAATPEYLNSFIH